MKKWSYLVLIVGWTLSMVYEALFVPELTGVYVLMAAVVDLVLLGLYAWELRKERRGDREPLPVTKGVYVAVCVLLCVLLGLAVFQAPQNQPPHVTFLPLYIVAIGASLGGAYVHALSQSKIPPPPKKPGPRDGE